MDSSLLLVYKTPKKFFLIINKKYEYYVLEPIYKIQKNQYILKQYINFKQKNISESF